MSASRLTTRSDRLSEHVCPGRARTYETELGLETMNLTMTTERTESFLDHVAPTRPNNRRLSAALPYDADLSNRNLISPSSFRDPGSYLQALPICTSTINESWSLHSRPILLCDNDGTFHSLLASISLPIPFPDYGQHYHIINTSHVLFHHMLHIPSIFQFSLGRG